jgi:Glycosyltransferases involved in cell wall biogenesis
MKKLVIIPAYNEMASIVDTVREVEKNAAEFDYVVINDCSTDKTRELCIEHKLNFIDLPVNLGIGGAVQTGYQYAYQNGYDLAVQVDGDGQHDPTFLEKMANVLIQEKQDMVIGTRFINKEGFQSSGIRRMGIRYFTFLIKILTKKEVTDPTSGLRMVGKKGIEVFAKDYPKDYPEPESVVLILRKGMQVKEIPVLMRERSGGVSSISVKKSIYYMIKVTLAILLECIRKR